MTIGALDLEQFMRQCWVKLPGASEPGIKVEMFDVIKEFFDTTSAWTENIAFTAVNGTVAYSLTPTDGQIIRLVGVWDSEMNYKPASLEDFTTLRLMFVPAAVANNPWFARIIKNILLPAGSDMTPIAPDWLLKVYSVPILDGTLGRMMAQESKSYSNMEQSKYHLTRFRAGMQAARIAALRLNAVGEQDWVYPRGWAVSSEAGDTRTPWTTQEGDANRSLQGPADGLTRGK